MFEKKGKYFINEFQEDPFNKELPSTSIKISYINKRQKILNINQKKFQLDLIREKIHQKCRNQELQFLEQLQKEKQRFNQIKQEEEKKRKDYLIDMMAKKYQIQVKQKLNNSLDSRDSLDQLKNSSIHDFKSRRIRPQFSLEPNQKMKKQQYVQNQWVNRVREARKKTEIQMRKLYEPKPIQEGSESSKSSISQSELSQIYSNK